MELYPGSTASVSEVVELAESYYGAAKALLANAKGGGPLSWAPARLCSIHAVELYLNAFLRAEGLSTGEVRGRCHDLSDRAFARKLALRERTARHLVAMTEGREYLVSRYAPEAVPRLTHLNRLTATLEEVRTKTTVHLARRAAAGGDP